MSNSSLVKYTKISPNSSNPRNKKITKITIHHMAGNLTVEKCGEIFASSSRQASSNYGIGTDGRIALYVDESNRAWTSGNADNDNQAVTIEVANDGGAAQNWHVSDKALAALIDLCVDICKRNGIDSLNFTGDANGNLTMHKYFQATACPGPYLESKFPYIAQEVNKRLKPAQQPSSNAAVIKLIKGAKYFDGTPIPDWVINSTLYHRGTNANGVLFSTQKTGAITGVVKADQIAGNQQQQPTASKAGLKDGDVIKLKAGAKYSNGASIPGWVLGSTLYYRGTNANGVIISTQKTGAITGVVNASFVEGAVAAQPSFNSYRAKVTTDALNIRKGPGTNYGVAGVIRDKGIYTIVEEKNGFGKLKSGTGWISLDYVKKV